MSEIKGIINVLKPPGMTSFDVVKSIKKIFNVRKAGHTGTLDPGAAGVLPVCLGRATKIIPYIPEDKKEYIGEITLGVYTNTFDSDGEIIERDNNWEDLKEKDIVDVFKDFTGLIEQIPPMHSALHYRGKRLYELARQGKKVNRQSRKVLIEELEVMTINLPTIKFRVKCSRGTYVRSLAVDIGEKLGSNAYLSFLLRTQSGPFILKDSHSIEEIKEKKSSIILPIDYPLNYLSLTIKDSSFKKASNGVQLEEDDFISLPGNILNGTKVAVYKKDGTFISISEVIYTPTEGVSFKPVRVFI